MRYAVGIPTRNREDMLARTINTVLGQTERPEMIVVVDNNDEPNVGWREASGVRIVRVRCDFRTTGPEQGHQTALRLVAKEYPDLDVMVRWDDDLIPEPDCLARLVSQIDCRGVVACGGMYPRPGDARVSSADGSGDGVDRHLQFFAWSGESRIVTRKHLYSSFAYSVPAALRAGGFCVDYSKFGQRGETDFSLRLAREGELRVDTAAVAFHHWSPGGRRTSEEEMAVLATMDNDLFLRRMVEHKIDPEAW